MIIRPINERIKYSPTTLYLTMSDNLFPFYKRKPTAYIPFTLTEKEKEVLSKWFNTR